VYFAAQRWLPLHGVDLLTASLGAGLVSAETTRYAIGWVVERYAARGPLSERIAGLAAADDAVPLLLLAVPFALIAPNAPYAVAWWGWSLATLALGALLGMTSALLLRFAASASDSFGVLLGAALLGSGIAWRLGLSALTAMFALGATLAVFSRHRDELTSLLTRTEQPVLLPALLLAGAALHLEITAGAGIVLGVACGTRMLVRGLAALLVGAVADPSRRPGPMLSLALLPTGGLTITLGLACTLRFPGAVGDLILAVAVAQTLLGELLGPTGLRIALRRAGEITEAPRGVDAELAA
jgi:Kef-type K+ transport system membrane component KefB